MSDIRVSLCDTQRAFSAALTDGARSAPAQALFALDPATAARRLALYRANVVGAVRRALAGTYPVLEQIVGADFFAGMARRYWKEMPSTSGDLGEYGAQLGEFIERFAPAAELPYLADVARLEWKVHCAARAADAPRLAADRLQQVDARDQAQLRFRFLPGTALLSSQHPIGRIWQIHQPEFTGQFSVNHALGEQVVVARDAFDVGVRALSAGAFALYRAFAAGDALIDALDAALAAEPGCDGTVLLVDFLQSAPISDFSLTPLAKDSP